MISNPNWLKPKEKPCMHQISINCLEMLTECQRALNKGMIDHAKWVETMECVLRGEIEDLGFLSFSIDNYSELFCYISSGIRNIRIHRDIEGKIWFGAVDSKDDLSQKNFEC